VGRRSTSSLDDSYTACAACSTAKARDTSAGDSCGAAAAAEVAAAALAALAGVIDASANAGYFMFVAVNQGRTLVPYSA